MKKCLTLLLVFALAFTTFLSAMAEDAQDRFGKYDEVVELTYLSTDTNILVPYDANDPARKSATENAWIDGYLENLNIKLNRIIAEDAEALNARLNTAMAGGTLPDIMRVSKSMFYVLAENGVLQDLTEAYDGYEHKEYLSQIEESYPALREVGTYEGELLGYPIVGNRYNGSDVLWVRQDWLDKVGMSAPTTIEEMIAVAKAFVEAKLGGDNTVGLAFDNEDLGEGVLAAYDAVYNTWTEQADGTYAFANTLPQVADGLLALQGIYKEGLVRSDYVTAKLRDEDVANSVCGMFYGDVTQGVLCVQTSFNNDPEAAWIPVRIPTLDGEPVKQWTNGTATGFLCVSAACENPEALFKLVEFENAMRFSTDPEEMHTYNVAEDNYNMWSLGAFRDVVRADTDLYKGELIAEGLKNNTPPDEMHSLSHSNYLLVLDAVAGNRAYLGRWIAFVDGYGITIPLLAEGYLVSEYNGPETEAMTLYLVNINEALKNAMIKVVMGEDISVWEKAVQDWYASGGQTITDEVNAYYQSLR